jgi:alpha-tubulin suppressor-like RCC1 family protein
VTYGSPNAKSGVGWARDEYLSGEDNPIRLSPTEASLSHLDPALRNFTKIVTSSRDLIMALTSTGQLLSWGCNNAPGFPSIECSAVSPNFVSNSGYNVYLPIPIPVDAAFYDNKKVLDIAVTSSDGGSSKYSFAVALLEDGSLVWWGEFEAMAVYRRDASNIRLIGPQSKYDLARTTFENIPFDRFTSVHASNSLMWATSGNGSIWAWNPVSTDMARPTEIFPEIEFGRIELFDGCDDVLIALVNDSDSGTRRLLSFQRSSIFDCNYFDMSSPSGDLSYCEVQPNAVTIDYSDIRQILVYENLLILALTDDGIYALGRGALTRGVNFVEFTQIPFSIAGIESYSEVKKIAFSGVGLIAITHDGRLFSTNIGEYQPNPYQNLYDASMSEILLLTEVSAPEWFIEDISSDVRAYAGISRHVLARKATYSSAPVQPTPQQAELEIETVAFGSDATCAYGDGKCRSNPSEVFKFPDNHPINSPTATNIELNLVGSIVDGQINATTPRIIRWGGQSLTSEPAMVRYLGTVYAELPEHWNHTQSSLENIKLIKVVPVGLSHISAYSNCRVDVQWFTEDGPTGLSGLSEPARKRSIQSNFPGPGARGDPIKVDDPSYTRTLDRVHYITDHWDVFWEESLYNTECFNEVTGAQSLSRVEDLQCSIASFELEVGRAPLASHCLLRTTNSLYSFGVFYNFYEPCSMGLFGAVSSCQAAASYYNDEIIPMIRISDDEDSAIYQKKVVQYQLGAQHVVALTSDGSIVAWGDNSYSQLGLGDYASAVPEDGSGIAERRRDMTYRKGTPTKVAVPEYFGSPWRKVIASAYASFALSQDHVLVGWGSN